MRSGQDFSNNTPTNSNFGISDVSASAEDYLSKKRGIGICIISRGTVPIKWMMHMNMVKNCFPGGTFWKYIIVERLSWAAARSECVRKCRANNFQWLFFIDDDVFVPEHTLEMLLRSGKDVISGLYWTKSATPAPVIFKELGAGPMYNFEVDKVIPIGGSGLGCCLINMDVFDKFDEAGIPYFVENWVYTAPDGNKMKCPIGEDHYFFLKAKEFGYQPYCHTGILCDHYDSKNDKFFPGQEVVREISKNKLREMGREDLVQQYEKSQRDPGKKTIVIFNNNMPFAGDEITRRGIGGSEHDVISLAREFAKTKRFNVRVYCKCLREGTYDNVIYKDNKKLGKELKDLKCDLFISSRSIDPFLDPDLKKNFGIKQTILWGHDMAEDPMWANFEKVIPNVDKVVLLSEFHKKNVLSKFPALPEDKIVILRNGVNLFRYKDRDKIKKIKGKCIYSSTPYRGLEILLKIWPQIKKRVPHAELFVFSSIKVYGEFFDDTPWNELYDKAKKLEGVKYYGTIKQDRLAKEQMESELLLYPNTFDETCCCTAMENISAGTPIVTTNRGALPDIIPKGCGVIIDGNPFTEEYQKAYIDAAVELLNNHDKWNEMHEECLKHDFCWKDLSTKWIDIFFKETELPEIPQFANKDEIYKKELEQEHFRVNPQRFNYLKQFAREDDKILNVSCGLGAFSRFLRQSFPKAEIWGSDQSMFALDHCRQNDKTIFYANHPIENPEYEKDYFDIIYCQEIADLMDKSLMEKLKRILKPKGKIIGVIPLDKTREEIIKLFEAFDCQLEINSVTPAMEGNIISIEWNESNLNAKNRT